jgi:hypothetical protein
LTFYSHGSYGFLSFSPSQLEKGLVSDYKDGLFYSLVLFFVGLFFFVSQSGLDLFCFPASLLARGIP